MRKKEKSAPRVAVIENLEGRTHFSAAHPVAGSGVVFYELLNPKAVSNDFGPILADSLGTAKLRKQNTDALSATIHWGNGVVTTGATTNSDGINVNVWNGFYAYSKAGNYDVKVDVVDNDSGTIVAVIHSRAVIEKNLTAGKMLHTTVGTAIDKLIGKYYSPSQLVDQYSAKDFIISWGDQSSDTAATIVIRGDVFLISGSHNYLTPGTYKVEVSYQPSQPTFGLTLVDPLLFTSEIVVKS